MKTLQRAPQTPFYDPNNYIFGETMNQDMVKCGEYIGDGSSDAWGGIFFWEFVLDGWSDTGLSSEWFTKVDMPTHH